MASLLLRAVPYALRGLARIGPRVSSRMIARANSRALLSNARNLRNARSQVNYARNARGGEMYTPFGKRFIKPMVQMGEKIFAKRAGIARAGKVIGGLTALSGVGKLIADNFEAEEPPNKRRKVTPLVQNSPSMPVVATSPWSVSHTGIRSNYPRRTIRSNRTGHMKKRKYSKKKSKKTRKGKKKQHKRKHKKKITLGTIKSKGIVQTNEITGRINDPDCVYLGYAAYSSPQALDMVCAGLVKMIFERSGIRMTNINDTIPGVGGTNDIAVYIYADDVVVAGSQAFQSGAASYGMIAIWLRSQFDIIAKETNADSATNTLNFKYIKLFMPVAAGILTPQATLHLDDITVNLAAFNEFRFQNRSVSYEGSASTDTVNTNPLVGKVYDFSAQPRTILDRMKGLQVFDFESGMLLKRAQEFAGAGEMKEPPSGRVFTNHKKTEKIVVAPGEIHVSKLYYNCSKPLIKFVKELRMRKSAADLIYTTGLVTFLPCPCQIVALEDAINFNDTNKISVAYELNRQQGVLLTQKKRFVTQQTYGSSGISNFVV